MLGDKRVLVVVPARGGSKGIPLKNIAKLCGRTLIEHTAIVAHSLRYADAKIVSTDHRDIAEAAIFSGLQVPFTRPPELSGDLVGDLDVLTHALTEMERLDGVIYHVIVMLQPTCPLRKPEHVNRAALGLVRGGFDSVWTVSPTPLKYHPYKSLNVQPDGRLGYSFTCGPDIIARQQLDQTYYRNGAAYAFTRECLLEQKTIMGKRAAAIVIEEPLVNIDTREDLEEAEWLMRVGQTPDHACQHGTTCVPGPI